MSLRVIFFCACLITGNVLFAQTKAKTAANTNDSVRIEVNKLDDNINSDFMDYAPVITADRHQMFFTSRRPYTEKEKKKNKESMENVYVSTADEKGNWGPAQPLTDNINVKDRNNSNIAISTDGQRLLIYQDDRNGNGDIFECNLKGDKWSDPVSLGQPICSQFHESSATISPDGKTLYFVSDRTGGAGGRDIWMCTKSLKGVWGKPENLGRTVNTILDEDAIFIHPDGKTLFFSSKGHKGLGGYDIYKTVFIKGKWSKPVNIGAPINTDADDLFFVLDASGKKGYYSSEKAGTRDIYEVNFIPLRKQTGEPHVTVLKGTVKDAVTLVPVEAIIEIIDNEKNEIISSFKSNSATGRYLVTLPSGKNYGIHVSAPGYLFHSENFELADTASYNEVTKDILLNKIQKGTKVILRNIFFDTGKSTLRPQSLAELGRLKEILTNNPTIKIEISGHTDNQGGDEMNQKLSEARAKAVVDYLVTNGIEQGRLTFKGYGKTQPVATNDNDDGRQQNRRTEFKITDM